MQNETKKPIKVAHVIGMAIDGGTESVWINYYRNIDRTKVQFDFLVESESKIINKQEIESLGGHVVIIPPYKKLFKYMKELKRIFKENQYDIVHSNMNALSVFTLRAAKKAGIKVRIAHSHSTSNKKEWKKNIVKNMLRPLSKKYATHYYACSEHAGRWLFGNKTFDKGLVKIIYNAIDLERFNFNQENRDLIRKEYNIEDKYVIGHVGRFMQQKNHVFLIDVFNEFQKTRNDAVLLLIGDGPLKEELFNKVNELNVQDKVIFGGVHKDVEKYYSAMDSFLFPSIYEGLGMTLVEAQVNGLPCLASNFIPKEAIVDTNTKLLELDITKWIQNMNDLNRTNSKNCDISKYDIKKKAIDLVEGYYSILD